MHLGCACATIVGQPKRWMGIESCNIEGLPAWTVAYITLASGEANHLSKLLRLTVINLSKKATQWWPWFALREESGRYSQDIEEFGQVSVFPMYSGAQNSKLIILLYIVAVFGILSEVAKCPLRALSQNTLVRPNFVALLRILRLLRLYLRHFACGVLNMVTPDGTNGTERLRSL